MTIEESTSVRGKVWPEGEPRFVTEGRETNAATRIVWEGGDAWRLRKLRVGNSPWALPGSEELFRPSRLQGSSSAGRIQVVVGGRHGGLTSFYRWLMTERDGIRARSVDLADAELAGNDSETRLSAIAHALRTQDSPPPDSPEGADPFVQLRALSSGSDSGGSPVVVFRNISSLTSETADRFFGRLRSLYEDASNPPGDLQVVLLGRSIRPLDPEDNKPVSTLLSLAEVWTPTPLKRPEVRELTGKASTDFTTESLEDLWDWTGGEPLLVQAVLRLLESNLPTTVLDPAEAIESIDRERLPAFDTWMAELVKSMQIDSELERIVHRLLRFGSVENGTRIRRLSLLDLFVDGWIRPEPEDQRVPNQWVFRSRCRRQIAGEAYAAR